MLLLVGLIGLSFSTVSARTDMTTSMVDFWDMDESSGDLTGEHASISVTEINGTIGTGTIGGRAARDLEFDSAQYFSAADSAALSLSSDQDFTIALRVRLESTGAGCCARVMASKDDPTFSQREWILYYVDGGDVLFGVWDSGGTLGYATGAFPSSVTGVDYTIVAWHDSTANQVGFKINDGTAVTSSWTSGTRDTTAPFKIGQSNGNSFDGRIGSFGMWKRVLSSAEMTEYYNGGSGVAYTDIDAAGGGSPTTCNGLLLGVGRCGLVYLLDLPVRVTD